MPPPFAETYDVRLNIKPVVDEEAMRQLRASLIVNIGSGMLLGAIVGALSARIARRLVGGKR